jgi:tetratricopeptide (TPR) repeat protein
VQHGKGLHLIRKSRFSQGLESLLKAERLFKENLSLYNHIINKLAKLYENAAFAYFCLKDNFNALVMWRKAINIRTTFNLNPSFTELY